MEYLDMEFTVDTMLLFEKLGLAINGTRGGLVMGNSHIEDGIHFFVRYDDKYLLKGNMEGFEFILNCVAAEYWAKITPLFHNFQEYVYDDFKEYVPNEEILLIDTRKLENPKYIFFEYGNFEIINRGSTKDFLGTLDELNKSIYYTLDSNGNPKIKHNSYDEIVIYKCDDYLGCFPAREK